MTNGRRGLDSLEVDIDRGLIIAIKTTFSVRTV